MEKETLKIITTEDGRGLIRNAIMEITQPTKIIAPFGYSPRFPISFLTKIIMQHPQYNPQNIGVAKYSNKIHLKLILGMIKNGSPIAVMGSCNFTENSITNMHEILIITTRSEDITKLEALFDRIWDRL